MKRKDESLAKAPDEKGLRQCRRGRDRTDDEGFGDLSDTISPRAHFSFCRDIVPEYTIKIKRPTIAGRSL